MSSFKPPSVQEGLKSHFGVYALIPRKNSLLLIKKTLGCYTGLYDLPGGSMEPHELLEETLYREVLEETSCTITSFSQLQTFSVLYPHIHEGQREVLRHIGAIYVAEVTGKPREFSDGADDSGGCVWMPFADITFKNSTPFVVEALKHYAEKT